MEEMVCTWYSITGPGTRPRGSRAEPTSVPETIFRVALLAAIISVLTSVIPKSSAKFCQMLTITERH